MIDDHGRPLAPWEPIDFRIEHVGYEMLRVSASSFLGSVRALWVCHTSLKTWCWDASNFGHVRWWYGFDHHSDNRWRISGAGPRSRSHFCDWVIMHKTGEQNMVRLCFSCSVMLRLYNYWCSHHASRFSRSATIQVLRCDFYLQRGSSLGARVCGSIASTPPSSSRLWSLTCAFWIRSCLPCDTLCQVNLTIQYESIWIKVTKWWRNCMELLNNAYNTVQF